MLQTTEEGLHPSLLDEQALVMIADEVLGGWGLLKKRRQELVAVNV